MRMPLFSRAKKRWLLPVTGLLLSSILLTACGEGTPSVLNSHGPIADSEGGVFWIILIIATIVFLGVEAVLVYSIFRYREKPGMGTPKQVHGDLRIEALWTIIPALILLVVLGVTINGLINVAPESQPADPNTVEVTAFGHQWWWEFYYPKYNITTADTMHVPTGTVVHVTLYSNNVIHSFWVPNLTGKTDLVPGHNNVKWFVARDAGTYQGYCAEFCGTEHANMKFNVVAEPMDAFNSWASTQQQDALTPAGGTLADQGRQVFANQCTTCHGIIGVNLKDRNTLDPQKNCDALDAKCLIGPNLTHFGSRNLIAGGVLDNNADKCTSTDPQVLLQQCNLAKWLKDPQGIKPGNDMAVNLTDADIVKLVAYLESLK